MLVLGLAVVRHHSSGGAVLLIARLAGGTIAAGVHHAAHTHLASGTRSTKEVGENHGEQLLPGLTGSQMRMNFLLKLPKPVVQ